VKGTEHTIPLDTLIVAVGEQPDVRAASEMKLETESWGGIRATQATMMTSMQGVFAGGDVVTGPNTVIDAIAAGKRAAKVIDRYLRDEPLTEPPRVELPQYYVEPLEVSEGEAGQQKRAESVAQPPESRIKSCEEVEQTLAGKDATREASRCLRCDLEFTKPE
jgi:NADH-quinone oxidoreductase subunit F